MSNNDYSELSWQLPVFSSKEFSIKHTDYCICVFIINEGDKFLSQLDKMQAYRKDIDIIIADGGSTDGSTEPDILKNYGVNTLLIKKDDGKLGAQMRMAFAWALKRGYKGVVAIDGNNKDSIENIPDFIKKLDEGYDHIQGSRFIHGGSHENTPLSRLLGVKLLHAPVIRIASGFNYTDTTNGFRAYSERLLRDPKLSIFRNVFTGYELHYYLAIKSMKLGYRVIETPVSRKYPDTGKTPTKISPIRGNLSVIQKLISVASGRYDPDI